MMQHTKNIYYISMKRKYKSMQNHLKNHLKNQTSPYLLQHADNPVEWYPWCDEAFERAKKEDKIVFLSIGYSTCHWCHVMAHESFEDNEIADILNKYFISIKVDREERPDIDSIYMSVCQAITGSGGWPTSIFMTPEQKPFFAGTYFPKEARYGQIGFKDLLLAVRERWATDREALLKSAEQIVDYLRTSSGAEDDFNAKLIDEAFEMYKSTFDKKNGGFGRAPKFPTPHNLLFLMQYYEKSKNDEALNMVEKTLLQMYYGGMFDHIGGGFSRYSTDDYFLAPHFEKMLYDNALLILAYCRAYGITKKNIYRYIAEKTAGYALREMTSSEGGFYSAQDADSEGVEGKYYLFEPSEIIKILGEKIGKEFNGYFDITEKGNFEGKNIPNLLKRGNSEQTREKWDDCMEDIYKYRKNRFALHLDDKILTAWNGLMIAAMCHIYRVTGKKVYLNAARSAETFIRKELCENDTLYVSYRDGKRSSKGFLDDYANEVFALIALYEATLESKYLDDAMQFCNKAVCDFYDEEHGGFFLYGKENEKLISQPKETYDGAMFSGNSAMAYNLVRLYLITEEKRCEELAGEQLKYMSTAAKQYPAGYAMFLIALSDYIEAPEKITVVAGDKNDRSDLDELPCRVSLSSILKYYEMPTDEYPLKNDRTTYYVCRNHSCLPPVNEL